VRRAGGRAVAPHSLGCSHEEQEEVMEASAHFGLAERGSVAAISFHIAQRLLEAMCAILVGARARG
jgi:hypothetical protein